MLSRKRIAQNLQINSTIWYLTVNDIFTWGLYFVVIVLMGLYLSTKFEANVAEIVGLGAGICYFTRALIQVPIGILGDQIRNERDELLFLMLGNFLMGLPVILITTIDSPGTFYFLQIIFGAGSALNIVDWRKLFAKNLDKGREGLEYAVYDTVISFATAILSILGGTIASINQQSFELVFTLIGLAMIASNIWVVLIYLSLRKQDRGAL